ncbi:radical SAM protein [Novosphingobium resinovorum]|uniref:radical SAM protein n=1 Tax=Novosphingobium resinovorum TaxID=158500 RepID=UPI003D2CCD4D
MLGGEADDLVVINSCAVTAEAVRQTRQVHPSRPQGPSRRAPPRHRLRGRSRARGASGDARGGRPHRQHRQARPARLERAAGHPRARHPRPHPRLRAGPDGCDHACTFCIIPQGRGPSRSRTVAQVLDDVVRHLDAGVQEVILTGVDLTSWGGRPSRRNPASARSPKRSSPGSPTCRACASPRSTAPKVDDLLFDLPRLGGPGHAPCAPLAAARPRPDPQAHEAPPFARRCGGRRPQPCAPRRPEIAIVADLIAGFPTEDDEAHAANLSIIEALGVVHGHVFPYSQRPRHSRRAHAAGGARDDPRPRRAVARKGSRNPRILACRASGLAAMGARRKGRERPRGRLRARPGSPRHAAPARWWK